MLKINKHHLIYSFVGTALSFGAQAGGIMLYEIGSDDMGLAAAGYSARAQDASTLLTNPAGMTRLQGDQVFVGATLLYEDIEFTPVNTSSFLGIDGGGNPIKVFPGGSAFYSHSLSDVFKAGIGIYGNFGSSFQYHGDWAGRYSAVKGTVLGTSIQPTLAYRCNGLSVGGGPVFMYGVWRTKTRINNSPFELTHFHDGELKLSDTTWGLGANLGLLYEFNEDARIGIAYNSQIKLNFKPDAVFTDLAFPLNTILSNRGILDSEVDIGLRVPQGVMASGFYQFSPLWAALVSAGWQNWKKFGQVNIAIDSTNPTSVTIDKNYKDTWHGAVGIQHHVKPDILFNIGVGYDSRFQPTENIPVNTPANSAWRFGLGTHFPLNACFDAGLNFEYIYGSTLHVNNHSLVTGDLTGEYQDVAVYFLGVNVNWRGR